MMIHIDCNCFYVSCELVSHPELSNQPVIVANHNEAGGGIILALNKTAKLLALKRGQPIFKVKNTLECYHVSVFSADIIKYAKISKQIMHIVHQQNIVQNFTQYSIDEFFGEIPIENSLKLKPYIEQVKNAIWQESGIPFSCGASDTYTLAKVATWYAKQYDGFKGICILPDDKRTTALQKIPIKEVWGIGRQSCSKLAANGIVSTEDFIKSPEYCVKKWMGLGGVRTWKEMQGFSCIALKHHKQHNSIMQRHTF